MNIIRRLIVIVASMPFRRYSIEKVFEKSRCTVRGGIYDGILEYIWQRKLHEYGAYIDRHAHFSSWPTFPHSQYGVFISGDAYIGKNCVIFQHVMIGSNTLIDSKGFGAPKIGDNCYICAGAKIIGDVKIGNNCRIAAGAIVVKDVPDNHVVVMSGETSIYKEEMDNHFYSIGKNGLWGYFTDEGKWIEVDEQTQALAEQKRENAKNR